MPTNVQYDVREKKNTINIWQDRHATRSAKLILGEDFL